MKTIFKNLAVSSVFKGDKAATWNKDNYNRNVVTIANTDTGVKIRFNYWTSIASPELKTENDLLFSLQCFMSDVTVGRDSFENFCSEFGYDVDSRSAHKTYKACVASYIKALDIMIQDDIESFYNELLELEL